MRATLQIALIFWLLLLLAASVRPQGTLTPGGEERSHLRIERELADHNARVKGLEESITELKSIHTAERLTAIESTQRTNQYLLMSILLAIVTLLLKDVRGWLRTKQ